MPALVGALDVAELINLIEEPAGVVQVPLEHIFPDKDVATTTALNHSAPSKGRKGVAAELRAAYPAIQAVEDIVSIALRYELCNGSRPHAAPVSVPTLVPAVDRDLALGRLVVRI